jgi:D-alanyl-D-alanine endopeptidase (penicillin-binding protein 7)
MIGNLRLKSSLLMALLIGVASCFAVSDAAAQQSQSAKKTSASKSKSAKAKPKKAKKPVTSAKRKKAEPEFRADGSPILRSHAFYVQDLQSGEVLLERNAGAVLPIASITKLMTAMVVLDANLPLHEDLLIGEGDIDTLRGTRSRLGMGTRLTREDMLRLALMSSENRAASALGRYYPGGERAFIAAMNRKATELGLNETRFADSTGLNAGNVSSARDLARMVTASSHYPLIREFSTTGDYVVRANGRPMAFHNTNPLVRNDRWQIGVSKTGFINESGKCLVMQAWFNSKPIAVVLLDSAGKLTRVADAQRIKRWLETTQASKVLATRTS